MKFNISGFTHKGTGVYDHNEDNILVNNNLLNEGEISLLDQENCMCFVSDGVGGNKAGHYASEFVLYYVSLQANEDCKLLNNQLPIISEKLIKETLRDKKHRGCACTLSGLIVKDDFVDFYHVGDSEIWLLRNDMLLKVSEDEVLDEDNPASPLINYFGGEKNNLKVNNEWIKPDVLPGDVFLLCSDGLFKSLNVKIIKSILLEEISVEEKIKKIKANCLEKGSDDNVSAIVVEVCE